MFGRDVFVLEPLGFFLGRVQDLAEGRESGRLASPADLGHPGQRRSTSAGSWPPVHAELGQHGVDDVLLLAEKAPEEMLGPDLLVAHLLGLGWAFWMASWDMTVNLIPSHGIAPPLGKYPYY